MGYDQPVCFNTASPYYIKDGVFRYTIPSGYNMARVRVNTYSDGSTIVNRGFDHFELIPERYYISPDAAPPISMHMGKEYISTKEFIEF